MGIDWFCVGGFWLFYWLSCEWFGSVWNGLGLGVERHCIALAAYSGLGRPDEQRARRHAADKRPPGELIWTAWFLVVRRVCGGF
jgi:hypothetical protein